MKRTSAPRVPVEIEAPTLDSSSGEMDYAVEGWPTTPPEPIARAPRPPPFRPLKVYAFGPSLGRTPINVRTLQVRYEPLKPGPVGERIAVVDWDSSRKCFYDPVDLEDPLIAMNGGLDPSESDPRFHQQMAYAIASDTLQRVETALGRVVRRRHAGAADTLRVVIYPHGGEMANAHSVRDHVVFGYFKADSLAKGRIVPGQTVFTCLSADVVVHQMGHVCLGAMRPDLMDAVGDNISLLEAMSDLTSLLFHLSYRDAVLDTIQRTAGVIYRSKLDPREDRSSEARISAELASSNLLLALSQDFGEATGRPDGLRSALQAPDPKALKTATEPHERGAIVVAAVFDAVFSIYQRRTLDLFRIYRAGGGRLLGNDVPEPLALRLCEEVERIAQRILYMCWRAIDYCPAMSLELGDFLRACITADFEFSRDDPWGLRDAMMQAFRLRGIASSSARFFTEDALRWPVIEDAAAIEMTEAAVGDYAKAHAAELGLRNRKLQVYPIEQARIAAPDDAPRTMFTTQVIETGKAARGVTLVFDGAGRLRYAIPSTSIEPTPGA